MPLPELSSNPLPAFVDLNTIRSMTKVAKSMAISRKAIGEIASQEAIVTSAGTKADKARALVMIQKLSQLIVNETGKAQNLVHKMKQQTRVYEKELKDAVG